MKKGDSGEDARWHEVKYSSGSLSVARNPEERSPFWVFEHGIVLHIIAIILILLPMGNTNCPRWLNKGKKRSKCQRLCNCLTLTYLKALMILSPCGIAAVSFRLSYFRNTAHSAQPITLLKLAETQIVIPRS
jgi:uncharacterized membrane protein